MVAPLPRGLGYPTDSTQSSYYPGLLRISKEEIAEVSRIVEAKKIHPENTRIQKTKLEHSMVYDVFQASVDTEDHPRVIEESNLGLIRLAPGDHSIELAHICRHLDYARKHSANAIQESYLAKCQQSFQTGDIEAYKESQKIWVKDVQPFVESILGFVEPYRDPFGVRAEFEGLVAIVNKEETKKLMDLAEGSAKFIRRLPWAQNATENDGKGPFEKALFESPDFTSLHSK
jgi:dipeptidyl-peptidase III